MTKKYFHRIKKYTFKPLSYGCFILLFCSNIHAADELSRTSFDESWVCHAKQNISHLEKLYEKLGAPNEVLRDKILALSYYLNLLSNPDMPPLTPCLQKEITKLIATFGNQLHIYAGE